MSDLNKDQELVRDGRKEVLQDDENAGLKVTVPLRDQIVNKLHKKLVDDKVPEKITNLWHAGNADRSEYLARQAEYIQIIEEFINPIYTASTDWGSALHLPTILTVVKTFHARMYSALTSIDPMFSAKARKAANVDRERLITDLMRYTIKDWSNGYMGMLDELDKWIWNWVATGCGIVKNRWEKQFTRFVDVEEIPVPTTRLEVDSEGQTVEVPDVRFEEREVAKTIVTCEGPVVENIKIEDLLIVGGEGDIHKADYVIQQYWLTASEIWTLVDQGIFKKEEAEKVIASGNDSKYKDQTGDLKQLRTETAGEANVDKEHEIKRYHILEAYLKHDVDGSGINADIIVWIHSDTRACLRATYLYRVMKTGRRPYCKIDFHKKQGATYGTGLVELLYSLGKEIDSIHNLRIDIGILTSMPFGFYRPSTSTREEKLAIEPGTLVPLDNPQTDIFFPNLGNRTGFTVQEEGMLMGLIERFTSMSELNYGLLGSQGAARTATGARALLGESNANLDIYLQRLNRGWKQVLIYIFQMLQQKIQPGFQFRIFGEDGKSYWETIEDTQVIKGMYDFELEPNSANSNKQVTLETANQIYQITANPVDLQLGIVTPLERYEAIRNFLLAHGVRDVGRYIRKPNQITRIFTPQEIADRILAGIDVPLDPTQDLEGFVQYVEFIMSEDEILGQFSPNHVAALQAKAQEAAALMEALRAQEAQTMAAQQQQMNAQASQVPSNLQLVGGSAGSGNAQA